MKSYIAAGILALALGVTAAGTQSGQSAPPQQTPDKPDQKKQEKPKKVWTDENIGQLSGVNITTASATPAAEGEKKQGEAAAAGEAGAAPAAGGAAPAKKELPPEKTAKFYIDKLTPLRAQLAEAEARIKQIQDGMSNSAGSSSNHINTTQQGPPGPPSDPNSQPPRPDNSIYGNQIVRPEDQLAYYEKRRDTLRQQIEDLEAQAISNGLTRGEIQ